MAPKSKKQKATENVEMPDADNNDDIEVDEDGLAVSTGAKKKKKKSKKAGFASQNRGAKYDYSQHWVKRDPETGKLTFDEWATNVLENLEHAKRDANLNLPKAVQSKSREATEDEKKKLEAAVEKHHQDNADRFKNYKFSGDLRPGKISPKIAIPLNPNNYPDYGLHPAGSCASEEAWDERVIPVINEGSTGEKDMTTMREACILGREVLNVSRNYVCEGVTGDQIDRILTQACIERNIYPSPLNYYTFPKSVCVSANEVICHGIPDDRPFEDKDIINLDVSIYYKGFHSDLNETYFINKPDEPSERLVKTAYNCLRAAAQMIKPGTLYRNLGKEIEKEAAKNDCSVVSSYCGHGIGKLFHGPPRVPHYKGSKQAGIMKVGHVFTIEPMINLGTSGGDLLWPDNWTAVTKDGERSSQFEHTFLVTETGYEVLTAHDFEFTREMQTWEELEKEKWCMR